MSCRSTTLFSIAAATLLVASIAMSQERDLPAAKPVPILAAWGGRAKYLPTVQTPLFVATEAEWRRVWMGWRKDEAVPFLNFNETIVMISLGGDTNDVVHMYCVDDKGNLRVASASTTLLGPGAADPNRPWHNFAVISRSGINSVLGVPLSKKQAETPR